MNPKTICLDKQKGELKDFKVRRIVMMMTMIMGGKVNQETKSKESERTTVDQDKRDLLPKECSV
jgi:hypothetical protein